MRMLTTHGEATIELLELMESERGHDLWTKAVGRAVVQVWDCRGPGCSAVFVRRFADGAVGGSALHGQCPVPAERRAAEPAAA